MVVQASGDDMRAWRLRGCGQSGLDICGQTYDAFDAFNHVRHPDTLHRAMDFMNLWWLHYVPTFELSYFKLLFILSSSVLHVIDTTGASSLAYADAQTYWHGCFRGLIDIAGVTVIEFGWTTSTETLTVRHYLIDGCPYWYQFRPLPRGHHQWTFLLMHFPGFCDT